MQGEKLKRSKLRPIINIKKESPSSTVVIENEHNYSKNKQEPNFMHTIYSHQLDSASIKQNHTGTSDQDEKIASQRLLCEICGRVLGSRQALKTHTKSQHIDIHSPGKVYRKRVDVIIPNEQLDKNHRYLSIMTKDQLSDVSRNSNAIIASAITRLSDTLDHLAQEISTTDDDRSSRISLTAKDPYNIINEDTLICEADSSSGPKKTCFCDTCGKGFANKYILATHKMCHSGIRPFSCHYCSKTYERRHFKEKESVKAGKEDGSESDKTLNSKKEICDLCGQSFVNKYVLATHRQFHSGIKPHSCGYCSKMFKTKGQMKAHEKRHKSNVF